MFMLNKGYTELNYNGFWATFGYGNFAAYKSDWTAFGGFDTVTFGTVWGGEDWDILRRYACPHHNHKFFADMVLQGGTI